MQKVILVRGDVSYMGALPLFEHSCKSILHCTCINTTAVFYLCSQAFITFQCFIIFTTTLYILHAVHSYLSSFVVLNNISGIETQSTC
jgi:hypothetical protein